MPTKTLSYVRFLEGHPTEKLVLFALAASIDLDDDNAPSGEALVAATGLARDTVYRTLQNLAKRGIIEIEQPGVGQNNVYRILFRPLALPSEVRSYDAGSYERKETVTRRDGEAAPPTATHLSMVVRGAAAPTTTKRPPTTVAKTEAEAVLWHIFDGLCGVVPDDASVAWQSTRLKCCRQCVEQNITADELQAAAASLGLQPGRGAGEAALITEVMAMRGQPTQKPGRTDTIQNGVALLRSARVHASN